MEETDRRQRIALARAVLSAVVRGSAWEVAHVTEPRDNCSMPFLVALAAPTPPTAEELSRLFADAARAARPPFDVALGVGFATLGDATVHAAAVVAGGETLATLGVRLPAGLVLLTTGGSVAQRARPSEALFTRSGGRCYAGAVRDEDAPQQTLDEMRRLVVRGLACCTGARAFDVGPWARHLNRGHLYMLAGAADWRSPRIEAEVAGDEVLVDRYPVCTLGTWEPHTENVAFVRLGQREPVPAGVVR